MCLYAEKPRSEETDQVNYLVQGNHFLRHRLIHQTGADCEENIEKWGLWIIRTVSEFCFQRLRF